MKNLPQKPFGLVFGANPTLGVCIVGLILILGKSLAAPPAGGLKIDPTTGLPIAGGPTINPNTGIPNGGGLAIDPSTGLPVAGSIPTPANPRLKPLPKPPVPKRTTKGQYNLKNGQVISGMIRAITSKGVLMKVVGVKESTRLPLYYMYPHELTRDSRSMNKFLVKANEQSPAFYHGFCLFHGYGKKPNIELALKHFEHSATKDGFIYAAAYLQWIYHSGDGVAANIRSATAWGDYAAQLAVAAGKRKTVAEATRRRANTMREAEERARATQLAAQRAQQLAAQQAAQRQESGVEKAVRLAGSDKATEYANAYNEHVPDINKLVFDIAKLEAWLVEKQFTTGADSVAQVKGIVKLQKITLSGLKDRCRRYESAIMKLAPDKFRIPRQGIGKWQPILPR